MNSELNLLELIKSMSKYYLCINQDMKSIKIIPGTLKLYVYIDYVWISPRMKHCSGLYCIL